jgi:hypothetical protein
MEKTNRAINRGGFVGDLILTCNEGLVTATGLDDVPREIMFLTPLPFLGI